MPHLRKSLSGRWASMCVPTTQVALDHFCRAEKANGCNEHPVEIGQSLGEGQAFFQLGLDSRIRPLGKDSEHIGPLAHHKS